MNSPRLTHSPLPVLANDSVMSNLVISAISSLQPPYQGPQKGTKKFLAFLSTVNYVAMGCYYFSLLGF